LFVFVLSGLVGVIVLNSSDSGGEVLFPLLTGCFGVSTLLLGLVSQGGVPSQRVDQKVSDSVLPGGLLGVLCGFLVGTFPAVSCSQAVALLSPLLGSPEAFIAAVSSANVSSILFSALTLVVLGKTRNGLMVAVGSLDYTSLYVFIASFLLGLLPASILVLVLSEKVLSVLSGSYRLVLAGVLSFLVVLSVLLGGVWGLAVLFVSAGLGVLAAVLGVRRTQCMGMLILPTLLFYFRMG
jgi:putative membrane protein